MPELPDSAHPILGIIVTILVIINVSNQELWQVISEVVELVLLAVTVLCYVLQPLMALCRCSPRADVTVLCVAAFDGVVSLQS